MYKSFAVLCTKVKGCLSVCERLDWSFYNFQRSLTLVYGRVSLGSLERGDIAPKKFLLHPRHLFLMQNKQNKNFLFPLGTYNKLISFFF